MGTGSPTFAEKVERVQIRTLPCFLMVVNDG